MTLMQHVERYAAFMRHLGYRYQTQERMLRAWARHAMAQGDRFARAESMIEWVFEASSPGSIRNRFGAVRRFAIWLNAEDPRHEIPPRSAVGRANRSRPTPRFLTPKQIKRLMDAALSLQPTDSITPHTYHYMFGLIAATGLRASEACALRLADLVPDGLIVRQTKFRKSRLIGLHHSTRTALNRYLEIRKQYGGSDEHLFVLDTGRPPAKTTLTHVFIKLARQTGLRGGPGEPGTRLHDLRHGFAVRSLETATKTDRDSVNRHILALSTYLGHASVSSTYWYLQATPALLRQIAETAENAHMQEGTQ